MGSHEMGFRKRWFGAEVYLPVALLGVIARDSTSDAREWSMEESETMRFLLNMLAVLLLAGLVAGGVWFYRDQQMSEETIEATRASVRTLQRQITVQAGLGTVDVNGRGWPKTVNPKWFSGHPPMNGLLTPDRPWLEVAPADHLNLEHPPVRMTIGEDIAAFWYNPGTGIVRARVPVTVSDRRATDLYNAINGTTLVSIFADQGPVEPRTVEASASEGAGTSDDDAN